MKLILSPRLTAFQPRCISFAYIFRGFSLPRTSNVVQYLICHVRSFLRGGGGGGL